MEPTQNPLARPRRIAVLGGGVGAIAAAFALTRREGWYRDYHITVYQQGWRLGGKGASGRNHRHHQRIEEHGLHMWWGFYDQAFSLMQQCHEVLGTDAVRLDALFSPQNSLGFIENIGGTTYQKLLPFPRNDDPLGGPPRAFALSHYAQGAARWCRYLSTVVQDAPLRRVLPEHAAPAVFLGLHRTLLRRLSRILSQVAAGTAEGSPPDRLLAAIVHALAAALGARRTAQEAPSSQRALIALVESLRAMLRPPTRTDSAEDVEARWYFVWLDFLLTSLCGMLRDNALRDWPTLAALDEEEFTSWLVRHGIDRQLTLPSALMRGLYDAAFCFLGGCTDQPRVSAAVILRVFLRMFLCYKGSYMWRMNGGMGDVIFAPLYLALQKRGEEAARASGHRDCLRFEFFHRVDHLKLSADRRRIEQVQVSRQATLRSDVYQPLQTLAESPLPVWPAEPLYDQLVEGEALRACREQHPDTCPLESRFSAWQPIEQRTLHLGQDFDLVLLGTSVAGLPSLTAELIAASPRWAEMTAQVKTLRTQAAQLWLRKTPYQLGWCSPEPSVIAGSADPLNSLADMSHVLGVESWPAADAPQSVIYLCGPMPDDPAEPDGPSPAYPGTQVQHVRQTLTTLLTRHAGALWPQGVNTATGEFDWDLLVAPAELRGAQRLQAQYVRANIDPSERYVLALPGMAKYRLAPGDSGFQNLFLAGDWTQTELSFGCVEAATQSGYTAAAAIVAALQAATAEPSPPPPAVELPRYRAPFAEQAFQPPYLLRGACFQTHVLRASSPHLQRLCDQYLNRAASAPTFQPLGPFVLLMLGYVHSNRSVHGPEAHFGDGPESSAAIVLPVRRSGDGGPELGLFPLCAVVDNSLSMATGREVFGFAKQIGWFDGNLEQPGDPLSVETLVFDRHQPSTRLSRRRWLSVRTMSSSPAPQRRRALSDALRQGWRSLRPRVSEPREQAARPPGPPSAPASALSSALRLLRSPQVPVYNLLQVRDPAAPDRARLQRVTKAYLTLDRVHAAGALPACEVTLAAFDSHPVARDVLGLPHGDQRLRPILSFWTRYDATQGAIVEEIALR